MMRPTRPPSIHTLARAAVALVLLCGTAGCGDGGDAAEPASTLTTDEFIAVVLELREADRAVEFSDSAQTDFEGRKREILERHGTTEEDLRRFLIRHGEDVDFLSELWDTLNQKLRHVPPRHDPAEGGRVPLEED